MLQVVASPMIVILTTQEVSFMLPEKIYSTSLMMIIIYGHRIFKLIVIMTTQEVSCMLPENIYSTGIAHDNRHLQLSYFQSDCYSDNSRGVIYAPREHL